MKGWEKEISRTHLLDIEPFCSLLAVSPHDSATWAGFSAPREAPLPTHIHTTLGMNMEQRLKPHNAGHLPACLHIGLGVGIWQSAASIDPRLLTYHTR